MCGWKDGRFRDWLSPGPGSLSPGGCCFSNGAAVASEFSLVLRLQDFHDKRGFYLAGSTAFAKHFENLGMSSELDRISRISKSMLGTS